MPDENDAKKNARRKASGRIFEDLRQRLEADLPDAQSPWQPSPTGPTYSPDLSLLSRLLSLPIRQGADSNTGRLGKMIDAWAAHELRRAGFDANQVWPRRTEPRVWPADYDRLLSKATKAEADVLSRLIAKAGLSQSNVLGRHYFKQIDVVIAQWDRGPELMISTKAQMSSFGNNLNNRFEEFVGDAHNLKGRFPLSATGVVFVVRSTIGDEGDQLARVVDMLRKLTEPGLYDATCLVSIEYTNDVSDRWPDSLDVFGGWPQGDPSGPRTEEYYPSMYESLDDAVKLRLDQVPDDLRPGRALAKLVETVLERTPVSEHSEVRARIQGS